MSHFGSASSNKIDFVHGPQYEKMPTVRRNLAVHRSVTPFVIRQPIWRPRLLERVYKPMRTSH